MPTRSRWRLTRVIGDGRITRAEHGQSAGNRP